MAETAPLTTAHAHARKAAKDIQDTHWTEAADEYQYAANDFARAARSTSDSEALRVLKLLEEQHQKIAHIIKSQEASPEVLSPKEEHAPKISSPTNETVDQPPSTTEKPATASKPKSSPAATAAPPKVGSQTRDTSPNLARDIASRRGIPQQHRNISVPGIASRGLQKTPEPQRRVRSTPSQVIPPSVMDSQASIQSAKRASKRVEDDEGFSKFYSNITTGTMSKLSSVLAYAGLPLTEAPTDHASELKAGKKRVTATNDPDVKNIFSKAALDAIEADHHRRGAEGKMFGPAESFYVVPHSGGTMSYADTAKLQQQQSLNKIIEDDDDAFVDARESPNPPSPRQHRRTGSQQHRRGSFGKLRTEEELELENSTLKQTLDQLAGRLANFEAHAQDASMAALTHSMVGMRPPPQSSAPSSDTAMMDRLRQLEQQLEKKSEEDERLRTLAANQEKTLKKWEKKFEALKSSAREKDKLRREKAGQGSDEASAAEGAES